MSKKMPKRCRQRRGSYFSLTVYHLFADFTTCACIFVRLFFAGGLPAGKGYCKGAIRKTTPQAIACEAFFSCSPSRFYGQKLSFTDRLRPERAFHTDRLNSRPYSFRANLPVTPYPSLFSGAFALYRSQFSGFCLPEQFFELF